MAVFQAVSQPLRLTDGRDSEPTEGESGDSLILFDASPSLASLLSYVAYFISLLSCPSHGTVFLLAHTNFVTGPSPDVFRHDVNSLSETVFMPI